MSEVKLNDTVKVHYTGTLNNGQVFDSSKDRDPLQFKVGSGQVIQGFDQALLGMTLNDTKTVNIPANEAYGPVRENLIAEIKKTQLPEGMNPEVGTPLATRREDGTEMIFKVIEVMEETLKIDGNHPLAGQDLNFEITLVDIAS